MAKAGEMSLTFGSLFAGIGGFDLGLERAGMVCKWQVEIDPFCRKVLAKHWPDVVRYEDVREVGEHNLEAVDVICGGFPCQDISYTGKGAGIAEGTRSGLWFEYYRIICDLRPRYVVVENVAALLTRGMDVVLGDLAACGYDAEWDCIPAATLGAPHRRDRLFIVAYRDGAGQLFRVGGRYLERVRSLRQWRETKYGFGSISKALREGRLGDFSNVPRVVDGVPNSVDRNKALGNAVVPAIAQVIGMTIQNHTGGYGEET